MAIVREAAPRTFDAVSGAIVTHLDQISRANAQTISFPGRQKGAQALTRSNDVRSHGSPGGINVA
jgi:hypothetical protein